MLRIDWSDRPALKLGIIATFLLSIGTIWWAIDYGRSQEAAYEEGARKGYAERAKHGCYDVANSKPAAAAIKQADAKPCTESKKGVEENDNRRDYADLVAQRSSALWAKIMGIAAVIGVALSLLGIVLVAITFNETRLANTIAKQATFRQLRAYVTVESAEKEGSVRVGEYPNFGCANITIHNSGATPANRIKIIYNRIDVIDGSLVYLPTEVSVPNIGGQARKTMPLAWVCWENVFNAKLAWPSNISGELVYQAVIPDEHGNVSEFTEHFDLEAFAPKISGPVKMEITGMPQKTNFA